MPEQSDSDDRILRTIALKLVCGSLQCDGLTGEMYLIGHMSERPPDEWSARFWFPQFEATPGRVLWPLSLSEEFTKILKERFWRDVRSGQNGAARIQVNGSFAAFIGPLPTTPVWTEVRTPKGGALIPRSAIVSSTIRWWTEVHLSVIRLRLNPLVEALRRDGGLVDLALDQLRAQGLLPAALLASSNSPAQALHWIEALLVQHRPSKGEAKKAWRNAWRPNKLYMSGIGCQQTMTSGAGVAETRLSHIGSLEPPDANHVRNHKNDIDHVINSWLVHAAHRIGCG